MADAVNRARQHIGLHHHAGAAAVVAGVGTRLDVGQRQFVDEARGQLAGPAAINLPVRREADPRLLAGAGDANIGEAPLLLEALLALLVDAPL